MSQSYHPKRMKNKRNGPGATLPLLIAAAAVCVCLLLIPSAGKSAPPAAEVTPSVQPEVTPVGVSGCGAHPHRHPRALSRGCL